MTARTAIAATLLVAAGGCCTYSIVQNKEAKETLAVYARSLGVDDPVRLATYVHEASGTRDPAARTCLFPSCVLPGHRYTVEAGRVLRTHAQGDHYCFFRGSVLERQEMEHLVRLFATNGQDVPQLRSSLRSIATALRKVREALADDEKTRLEGRTYFSLLNNLSGDGYARLHDPVVEAAMQTHGPFLLSGDAVVWSLIRQFLSDFRSEAEDTTDQSVLRESFRGIPANKPLEIVETIRRTKAVHELLLPLRPSHRALGDLLRVLEREIPPPR